MTLDEAIAYAREMAEKRTDLCESSRSEHAQFADWLQELKDRREQEKAMGTWKRTCVTNTLWCTACNSISRFQIETQFCPECGARMRDSRPIGRCNHDE